MNRTTQNVKRTIALDAGLLPGLYSAGAAAQGYPTRPVRVVNIAAGSLADSVTRLVSPRVSEALGQQFIVDSRPAGAGRHAQSYR